MKKVLLSVALMFAICATSSVMAQNVKNDASAQKTECAKACSKSDDKKCEKKCEKKCDKKSEKKCTAATDKKCCKDNKQATTGKKSK